jgi:hypothetical protein
MSQSANGTARYCFSNGYKATVTQTGSSTRVIGTITGLTCLAGTITTNGSTSTTVNDPGPCGSFEVISNGTSMLTYVCNGVATNVDTSSAACQADAQAYGYLANANAFANCTAGTCL